MELSLRKETVFITTNNDITIIKHMLNPTGFTDQPTIQNEHYQHDHSYDDIYYLPMPCTIS